MLSGRGFKEVYNLSGGIKAWDKETAVGDEFAGIALLQGGEDLQKTLIVAYSMEQGLRDFYLGMIDKLTDTKAKKTATLLADVEIKHQESLLALYRKITGQAIDTAVFETEHVHAVAEGGLSTDQYIALFGPQPTTTHDIAALAISIEAQALDLYQRTAEHSQGTTKEFLLKIANEEQAHLNMLAQLFEET